MKRVTSKGMKKRSANRINAWILTAALTFSMCPVNVVSAENAGISEVQAEETNTEEVRESVEAVPDENDNEEGISEIVENVEESIIEEEKTDIVEKQESLPEKNVGNDKNQSDDVDEENARVDDNVIYRFHILRGKTEIVAYEFNNKALSEVKGVLDLNVSMDTTKDFGQGFGSVVINPATDKGFMSKVTTLVPLGAKKAGRYVFVFQKNMKSNKLEPVSQCKIDKNGNIALIGVDYADLVILY